MATGRMEHTRRPDDLLGGRLSYSSSPSRFDPRCINSAWRLTSEGRWRARQSFCERLYSGQKTAVNAVFRFLLARSVLELCSQGWIDGVTGNVTPSTRRSAERLGGTTTRTPSAPHPFFLEDATKRAEVVKFLKSLDDQPLK